VTKANIALLRASGAGQVSAFGVGTLVPLISDDVDITISAAFERQS
jgi:hypothetical protein